MATFELYLKTDGRYCFDFKTSDGEAIFSSCGFESKDDCVEIVGWIRDSSIEKAYDRKISAGDAYSFCLRDEQGKMVCSSQGYTSAPELTRKINLVRNSASSAQIIDLTVAKMEVDSLVDHPSPTVR